MGTLHESEGNWTTAPTSCQSFIIGYPVAFTKMVATKYSNNGYTGRGTNNIIKSIGKQLQIALLSMLRPLERALGFLTQKNPGFSTSGLVRNSMK
jgi:hypothetical protein